MKSLKEEVLLGCGLDSGTASELSAASLTLGKLRKLSDTKLAALHLDPEARSRIKRPPIPSDTLFRVLEKSRRTCCVCRTPGHSIIIHHIQEWEKTRSHDERNLAVLCLNDHGEAHTLRKLGQNLTPNTISRCKKEWEREVSEANGRALIGLSRVQGANWDYINHNRLFRLADQMRIDVTAMRAFAVVKSLRMTSRHGEISDVQKWKTGRRPQFYLYDVGEGRHLYAYTSELLETVIQKLGAVDVSVYSREGLNAAVEDGMLVFSQGPVYFRKVTRNRSGGRGQTRKAYMKNTALELDFSFDAWECTSTSSWGGGRLSGRKVASIVGLVSGKQVRAGRVFIQLSCLGIGTFFERIHWGTWHHRMNSMAEGEDVFGGEDDFGEGDISIERSLSDLHGLSDFPKKA
jgi:hypothetical protein